MYLPILAVVFVVFLFWTWRSNELFCISVRNGKLLIVRGRVPAGLMGEFRTVLSNVQSATIRVQKTQNCGRLTASGVDEGKLQRLRNIFGLCPQAQLRSAKPIVNPSLGQVLGIAWLAWWLDRRG